MRYGLSAKDTASVLKNGLRLSQKAVNGALQTAGYAAKEISDLAGKAADWFKKL
jgi:hypothetical protein